MISSDQKTCSTFYSCVCTSTLVIILIFQVCGEGHQVPAGPGADQRDGRTVSALWAFLPFTNICQLHAVTTEEETGGQAESSPVNTGVTDSSSALNRN